MQIMNYCQWRIWSLPAADYNGATDDDEDKTYHSLITHQTYDHDEHGDVTKIGSEVFDNRLQRQIDRECYEYYKFDPEDDPFDPEKFEEKERDMNVTPPPKAYDPSQVPLALRAHIDLLLLLRKAGCPLNVYDKVISWIKHYTNKKEDIFTNSVLYTRGFMLVAASKLVNTDKR